MVIREWFFDISMKYYKMNKLINNIILYFLAIVLVLFYVVVLIKSFDYSSTSSEYKAYYIDGTSAHYSPAGEGK